MRFDPEQAMTASDVVNTFSESDLSSIIAEYGEESRSRQIARQVIASRPLRTTLDLSRAVLRSTGTRRGKIHPATKTFQALRIAVNHELDNIGIALAQATGLLGFQGRLVVISYHSLEDRLVKNMMRQEARECICPPQIIQCICGHKSSLRLVHAKAIRPSGSEVESNPRSRSAKLRTVERVS
jgi:16S rRNA (cytosine1402-N4)-methyltransferase